VATEPGRNTYVYAQGFAGRDGKRKILFVNRRNRTIEVKFADSKSAEITRIDQTTNFNAPANEKITGDTLALGGFAVAVVTLP